MKGDEHAIARHFVAVSTNADTRAMLGGFDEMDEHFRSAPFKRNLPVLMGLLAIWYNNLWRQMVAVLPYENI
jgi:glucose-6-phosphate isomerase